MYQELSKNKLFEDCFAEQLQEKFPGISADIIKNHFANKDKKPQGHRHSDEAKKFALTLNFYSPRAYEYVRKIFSLPVARSISYWTSSVDCDPGFFDDVFDHIEKLIQKDRKHADVTLVIDAMSIQQARDWCKYRDAIQGLTNYGKGYSP